MLKSKRLRLVRIVGFVVWCVGSIGIGFLLYDFVGAMVVATIWALTIWAITGPNKSPPADPQLPEGQTSGATGAELTSMKLAYRIAGRPSQIRRIVTLVAIAGFLLNIPTSVFLDDGLIGRILVTCLIPFIGALILEALKDSRFRRKQPELHRRFSIWQPSDASDVVKTYRRAVRDRWVKGRDPDWYADSKLR